MRAGLPERLAQTGMHISGRSGHESRPTAAGPRWRKPGRAPAWKHLPI